MKIKLEVISEKFKQLVIRNVIGNGYHMTVVQPNLIRLHAVCTKESHSLNCVEVNHAPGSYVYTMGICTGKFQDG